jgi:hypothetical protein
MGGDTILGKGKGKSYYYHLSFVAKSNYLFFVPNVHSSEKFVVFSKQAMIDI